jgi:hypothetical protein
MAQLLAVLALCMVPAEIVNDCGVVEINTVLDEHGRERFTQVIYRDHAGKVRDWRMLKSPDMIPRHGVAVWCDAGVHRVVRCNYVRHTVTTYDPEIEDRKENPPHKRQKLLP